MSAEGDSPSGGDLPPILPIGAGIITDITYIVNGQVSDLVVVADVSNEHTNLLNVIYEIQNFGLQGLVFLELYNVFSKRWTFVDVLQLGGAPGGDVFNGANVQRARAFVNQDDGEVLIRLWTFGFGEGGFGNQPIGGANDSP